MPGRKQTPEKLKASGSARRRLTKCSVTIKTSTAFTSIMLCGEKPKAQLCLYRDGAARNFKLMKLLLTCITQKRCARWIAECNRQNHFIKEAGEFFSPA